MRLFLVAAMAAPLTAAPFLEKANLFQELTDGYTLYRIPGIVVTAQGSVLAYAEARKFSVADRGEIEIHMRRSTDGGKSWDRARQIAHLGPRLARNPHMSEAKKKKDMGGPDEQTVNNPIAIADRDGPVHFLYCVEYMRCFYMRSDDDGVSWSRPSQVTYAFDEYRRDLDWQVIATGPGHGIQLRSGRLVAPFWMATYEPGVAMRKASAVIYSDDSGKTWQRGEIAIPLGGESIVAELSDGSVMISARNTDPKNRRLVAVSRNGATDWSKPRFVEELLEPGCAAGLARHPGDSTTGGPLLLYSNPHTTDRRHSRRMDVTIKLSRDDGKTWPASKLLHAGPSAYSDLAVLPDGTILCFYESGPPEPVVRAGPKPRYWAYQYLTIARFNLDWLIDQGAAVGEHSPSLQ